MSNKTKKNIENGALYVFVITFVSSILLPFIWLILGSFKNMKELFNVPVQILPSTWNLDNYVAVFQSQPFGKYIINSFVISLMSTLIVIVIARMTRYSIARVEIKGKKIMLAALLSISLLPPVTLLNPIYQLLSKLHLLNSYLGLSMALVATELPMAVWFLTSFFQTIPMEVEESAMIDGASVTTTFTKILIPLITPGIFTVSILTFINAWNNYLFAQVFNPLEKARTVTVALTLFQQEYYVPWHIVSAAAIIVTAPLIIVVLVLQKRIISGMMDGGVKG